MEKNFNAGVIFVETYKKPIIVTHTATGVIPLAGVTLVEVLAGAAAVAGFLSAMGDDKFYPEHARALTARKDFSLT